ncbi:MAG: sugar-binding protein [Chloroflexota bacterium]
MLRSQWRSRTLAFLCMCTILSSLVLYAATSRAAPSDISANYEWKTLKTGAGGWVTGMNIHPDGDVVYAWTDVGGAYRLDQATQTWKQVVTAQSMPADDVVLDQYEGSLGLVSAPSDKNRAYLFFNTKFNTMVVFRSDDRGNTWERTGLEVDGGANRKGRQQGPHIAVDPANKDVVYVATAEQGLYKTENAGEQWMQVPTDQVPTGTDKDYGLSNVVFDTSSGTVDGKTQTIYVAAYNQGIYRSTNAGASWEKVPGGASDLNERVEDIEVASDGTLYTTLLSARQVWRLQGDTWTEITPPNPSNSRLSDVAVSPNDPCFIYVFTDGGDPWRSTDCGGEWTKLTKDRTANDVPWLAWTDEEFMSVGEVLFDPSDANTLWFAQGIGVWTASITGEEENVAWNSVSAGIEELVTNDIVVPPGGKPVAAHWDRALFHYEDIDSYPAEHGVTPRFNSGWDVDFSAQNPDFLVAVVDDHRRCCSGFVGPDNQSGYSTDGGKSWTVFPSITNGTHPEDLQFGNIAVAANDTSNIVTLPTYNKLGYYTKDRGETWTRYSLPGTDQGSHFQFFLSRRVLAADSVLANTFYLYHETEGLYRSENGGETWTQISDSSLPTKFPVGTFNATLATVPGQAGHLCYTPGFLDEEDTGIFCSQDGGVSWNELPGPTRVSTFGFGKAATDDGYPTIYLQGIVDGLEGIWRSTDAGQSWDRVIDYPLGIYDKVNAISGDPDIFGRVYVGFPGSSLAYGDIKDTAGIPTATPARPTETPTPDPVQLEVAPVATPPTIDGALTEEAWALDTPVSKLIEGTTDNSGSFGLAWDQDNLYIAVNVVDGSLINDSDLAWFDDSIEVYLDGNNDRAASYNQETDRQLALGWDDTTVWEQNGQTDGVVAATTATETGYSAELAIPWSNINQVASSGLQFGIDIGVNDDDDGAERDGQLLTYGTSDNWQSLVGLGSVELIDENSAPAPVRILPLGDSLTEGGEPPNGFHSYRGYLYNELTTNNYNVDFVGARQRTPHGGGDPDHSSRGGSSIGPDDSRYCYTPEPDLQCVENLNLTDNLEEYLQSDPDIILLLIGVNDMGGTQTRMPGEVGFERTNDPAETDDKLEALVNSITELQPDAKILVASLLPLKGYAEDWPMEDFLDVNAKAEELGNTSAIDSIYFVDMFNNVGLEADDYYDGIHLSQSGAQKMATVWYEALTDIIDTDQ